MTVRLDANAVTRILTPCVQLILSAMKSFDCAIINPSQTLMSTFREMGLELSALDDHAQNEDATAYVISALYSQIAA